MSTERLASMLTLIDRTRDDVLTCDEQAYFGDRRLLDATALRVMHIGEIASRLDPVLRSRHPSLPWRDMVATRNVIAHRYFDINHGLIRNVVLRHLEELRKTCAAELAVPDDQRE